MMPQGAWRLEIHETVSSTSAALIARAEAGEAERLAVLARRQTAGRGRQGREWSSPVGNLHLSVLLRPPGPARDLPQWSLLAGVALAETARAVVPDPAAIRLKWPNDLLRDGAKCAGILAESTLAPGGAIAWLVLGFGVNLAAAPARPDRATACLGPGLLPEQFAEALLARLDHWRDVWAAQGFAPVRAAWLGCGPAPGDALAVRAGPGWRHGTFAGLAPDGCLLLEEAGICRTIAAGEVHTRTSRGKRREMLLAVDAGNTNVVFAVHDGTEWRGRWRIATRPDRTSDEYAVWLLALLQHSGLRPAEIRRCVIGTVVPAALYNLRRLAREWFTCEPLIARAELDWGFEIRVDRPGEVGADRLLNSLAAHHHYRGPLVVIDFGTATTFDVVDSDGAYLGGVIAPGINLSLGALHKAAARLPRIGLGRPQAVIGRDTVSAMQSGIYWGYVGLIEGIVGRIRGEYEGAMKAIATGGLAPLFAEGTTVIETIDQDITLEGLRLLAERNPAPILAKT